MKLTDASTIVCGTAAIVTIIAFGYSFYKRSFRKGFSASNDSESKKRKQDSLDKIYAPLRIALVNTHFLVCKSTAYPTFGQRLFNAYDVFNHRRYFRSKCKGFIKALGDKGESVFVECDTSFPSSKIESIVESNPQLADRELIEMFHSLKVKASTPWEYEEKDIDEQQYRVSNHIYKRYSELHDDLHQNGDVLK